jgi:hypothetical protein
MTTAMTTAMAAPMMFAMLPLLDLILHQIPQDGATDRTEETVSRVLAEIVPCHAAADRAEEATFTLGHGWGVGVIVGGILVAGLRGELVGLPVRVVDLLWRCLAVLWLLGVLLRVLWWVTAKGKRQQGSPG